MVITLLYLSLNVWSITQQWQLVLPGNPFKDGKTTPYGVALYGLLLCCPLLIVTTIVTRLYARRSGAREWPNRLPRFANFELDTKNADGKAFQVFALCLFLVLPSAAIVHFQNKMVHGSVFRVLTNCEPASANDYCRSKQAVIEGWHDMLFANPRGIPSDGRLVYDPDLSKDIAPSFIPLWEPWTLVGLSALTLGFVAYSLKQVFKAPYPMKESRTKPLATYPFSTTLWTTYRSFTALPYLKSSAAWTWFGLGFGFAALFLAVGTSLGFTDNLLLSSGRAWFLPILLLVALTLFVGHKQFNYYFGNGGRKDGLFVKKLRQANQAEKTTDVLLALGGGVLLASAVSATWWFFVMSCYSGLVFLRCFFTLRRDVYWMHSAQRQGIAFIPALLDASHNGLKADAILAGWVFTHATFLVLALSFFFLLHEWTSLQLFIILWIAYFPVYFGLRYCSQGLSEGLARLLRRRI